MNDTKSFVKLHYLHALNELLNFSSFPNVFESIEIDHKVHYSCVPIFLNKKRQQFESFSLALEKIISYFNTARERCDNVLESYKKKCQYLIVSKFFLISIINSISFFILR